MAVRHEAFLRVCKPILDDIFDERPVADERSFVDSTAFELRKGVVDDDAMERMAVRNPSLPNWLNSLTALGPYEQSIIMDLFVNSIDISIFRGGTGSGKTSLVRFIHRHASQLAQNRSWQRKYDGCQYFLSCIDLHGIPDELTKEVPDGAGQDQQLRSLLDSVSEHLGSALADLFPQDTRPRIARQYSNVVWSESISPRHTTTVETVIWKLRQACDDDPDKWAALAPSEQYNVIETAIQKLGQAHERLIARLLPFVSIGRLHKAADCCFVLIIDNADPLPSYLQLGLYRTLHRFFSSTVTTNSGFRISLFLRLSSSIDPAYVFPDFSIAPHGCPEPSEIVFARLSQFLFSPHDYPRYRDLATEYRLLLMARLLSLWTALGDRSGYFSRVLDALAGTNLRNAFKQVRSWCTSPKHRHSSLRPEEADHIPRLARRALGCYMCDAIGKAVGRGLKERLQIEDIVSWHGEFGTDVAEREINLVISQVIFDVFRDFRLFDAPANENLDARMIAGHHARQAFEEAVEAGETDDLALEDSAFALELSDLIYLADSLSCGRELCKKTCESLAAALVPAIRDRVNAEGHFFGPAVEWKINHMVSVARRITDKPIDRSRLGRPFLMANTNLRRAVKKDFATRPVTSRYETATLLLEASETDKVWPLSAVNVFSNDNNQICPAALRILYLLRERKAATFSFLIDDFKRHGFEAEALRAAMDQLIGNDRRLVYSGITDWFIGVDRLFSEGSRHVRLSWAGFEYSNSLVILPVYLQWALSNVRQVESRVQLALSHGENVRQNTLPNRIEAARAGLELIMEDEFSRLKRSWDQLDETGDRQAELRRSELRCQSASCDIYFRSMSEFVFALASHARTIAHEYGSQAPQFEQICLLARKWLTTGRSWLEKIETLFGNGNQIWQEELTWAEKATNEMADP